MTDGEERAYEAGRRSALASVVQHCAVGLRGTVAGEPTVADLLAEREQAMAVLRRFAMRFAEVEELDLPDGEWPLDLHLADVVEKYVARWAAAHTEAVLHDVRQALTMLDAMGDRVPPGAKRHLTGAAKKLWDALP